MNKLSEIFKLNLKFIGTSKKLAIITVVGLSISIAMITQNFFFLDSFRTNAFNEFATNTTDTYIETNVDQARWLGLQLKSILESTVTTTLEESEFEPDELLHQEWISYRFMYLLLYNEKYHINEFHNTYIIGIDNAYLPLLEQLVTEGEAPEQREFCIVANSETLEDTDLTLNETFNVYIKLNERGNPWESYAAGIGFAGEEIEFTGIINIDEISFGTVSLPPELQVLVSMALSLGNELIITDFGNIQYIMTQIFYSRAEFSLNGRILFDLTKFDVFNLDDYISKMQIFINNLQEALIGVVEVYSTNYQFTMDPRVLPLLSNFRSEYRIFQIFLLIFMLPTLAMAITLTTFASSQIKKQRDLLIHNFHQRGASNKMLFAFMLLELLIYALIAVLIGFLIGWPYTLVALKSDGFFSFDAAASLPIINYRIIGICIGIGFAIAFSTNIFSIWRRTKTTIDEALQERVEKKPFWERFYIDIFLFITGLLMWLVSFSQLQGGTSAALEFAFYFAVPAPVFIIIGSIMIITRIYPFSVKILSNIIFKIPHLEISAISARNAIRRRASTNRTIILMTITFALTIASMIVPDSYRAYDLEDSYYQIGADIVVNNVDVLTPTYKNAVKAIEGIEEVSYVAVLELSNTESDLLYQIKIMGIELDNFSKVAFQEPEYTNNLGIDALLESINNDTDVIAQKDETSLLNLNENNTFIIKNWKLIGSDVVELLYTVTVVDFFQYWPTLYTHIPSSTSKELFIGFIGNISLPFIIARNDYDVVGKLFVKVKNGFSIKAVAEEIRETTQHETLNVEELLLISEGTLKATVLFGALNSSFIISLLISSATLITMMIVQGVEREKEIAIMKSMGIKPRQLFSFFITEALIILIFTMIIGILLGFGTSFMIMKILRIESLLPKHEMVFPLIKIVWTSAAIFGAGIISTIIPIILNSRKKIGGALKTI